MREVTIVVDDARLDHLSDVDAASMVATMLAERVYFDGGASMKISRIEVAEMTTSGTGKQA